MDEVSSTVTKAVSKKVVAALDLEEMADELAPKVRAGVMAGILRGINEVEWGEIVGDVIYGNSKAVASIVLKALGISEKRKKPGRR